MNILFILIATAPMIIGLVWIYRSFRRELVDDENFEDAMKSQFDFSENLIRFDEILEKQREKESELQAYLEHRFRAESDEYAMNNKIDKIKSEYKLNK